MSDLDVFRRDFSGILTGCANARRASLCGGSGSGEDLKIMALFERLAREAETIDPAVFAGLRAVTEQGLATRHFIPRREALLAQVGVLYWPKDVVDLVRWIAVQSSEDLDLCRKPVPILSPATQPRRHAGLDPARRRRDISYGRANDFYAGFGIVALLLSLWNVTLAFGQMHDRAFVAGHATVPATIVSIEPTSVGKSSGLARDVVLTFQQPHGEICRVVWHAALPSFEGAPGASLPVVPRSSACEVPIIPSRIGDPMQTFTLAAVLMAGGLVSLHMWGWLLRHPPRPFFQSLWLPPESRRHDPA
ncbi:hypothetical protein [Lichenifustis flavocetrariae]|uniref:Uncharacterized protein n=1 Tax=Lichenifustis flavocetrariae TaxID=2949735 RepID=A0AA42CR93_9HYPH|nr:hypothetical protein [Lichenifustis flavocetrariae]MCW6512230.1 hypothetical protein [Lichenifustis flavocetrariae]